MPEWLNGVIGLISGGSILAIMGLIMEHRRKKVDDTKQSIDDRISFWEKVAKMSDTRIENLEKRIDAYETNLRTLENHISLLENLIIRIKPDIDLPRRPELRGGPNTGINSNNIPLS